MAPIKLLLFTPLLIMKDSSLVPTSQRLFIPPFHLSVRNVHKTYPPPGIIDLFDFTKTETGRFALKGVSFSTSGCGPFALIGTSGSGKSTMLKILADTETAEEGAIEINLDSMRGRIFLNPYATHFEKTKTVEQNIMNALGHGYDSNSQRYDCYLHLIRVTDLFEVQSKHPSSLANREFYCFALALKLAEVARDRRYSFAPPVVAVDEWLDRADNRVQSPVCHMLKELAQGWGPRGLHLPVVMATHNLPLAAATAGETIFLISGEVAEVCPPSESTYISMELYDSRQKRQAFPLRHWSEGVSHKEAAQVKVSPAAIEGIKFIHLPSKDMESALWE